MKLNKIRILFLLILVFLFFQFAFLLKVSEPYPAIKLPGFGKIPQASEKVKYTKYEVVAFSSQNNYDTINTTKLFDRVPKNYIPNVLDRIIKKHNKKLSIHQQHYIEFKSWLYSRLLGMHKKKYYKAEIRKLEIVKDLRFENTPEVVNLEDKAEIKF